MQMDEQKGLHRQIVNELYRTLVLLGADHGLLGTVASWGEELPDEDVVANLQAWNYATEEEIKQRIEHYGISSHRPAHTPDAAERNPSPLGVGSSEQRPDH
jgi:hypothetical protein